MVNKISNYIPSTSKVTQQSKKAEVIQKAIDHFKNFRSDSKLLVSKNFQVTLLQKNDSLFKKIRFFIQRLFTKNEKNLISLLNEIHTFSKTDSSIKEEIKKTAEVFSLFKEVNTKNFIIKDKIQLHASLSKLIRSVENAIDDRPFFNEFELQNVIESKRSLNELTNDSLAENYLAMTIPSIVQIRNDTSIVEKGGFNQLVNDLEIKILTTFLETTGLSVDDKSKTQGYLQALTNGFSINSILDQIDGTSDCIFFETASKLAFDKVQQLENHQSILLDIGYPSHAARLGIKKIDTSFEITLYDTSGGLEIVESRNKLTALWHYLKHFRSFSTLSTKISDQTFKEQGREYLDQLFLLFTSDFEKSIEGSSKAKVYTSYIRLFKSINSKYTLDQRMVVQRGHNCFAHRLKASQRRYLGKDLANRYNVHFLKAIRAKLIEAIPQSEHLQNIPSKKLSNSELSAFTKRIKKLAHLPENNSDWEMMIKIINHKIAKQETLKT